MPSIHRPNLLKPLADAAGVTPRELVVRTIEETGSVAETSRKLGCSLSTIRHHLEMAGLVVERIHVVRLVPRPGKEAASE